MLAKDRKDRGEIDTAQVIAVYEEAQSLDPEYAWGSIELARLYQEAGRLAEGLRAAAAALARAEDDRNRSATETELCDILEAAGDLSGARACFERSLAIDERLAAANPTSATA